MKCWHAFPVHLNMLMLHEWVILHCQKKLGTMAESLEPIFPLIVCDFYTFFKQFF